ncbi:MAG: phage holin family protein [Legionellales bacterium]|nr:phage holin family protein [Legionellales bacterium]
MPSHPKISAALNNCPLHVLTPELRADIKSLAENEEAFPAKFKPAYETLKAQFSAFYLSDREESFSWQEFHTLLLSYNEFDIQILFGPVLRSVMAVNIRASREQLFSIYGMDDEEQEKFISAKTSLQDNGRYESLSPDEVFVYVAAHLGLMLTYHQGDQIRSFPDDGTLADFAGRPMVDLFHEGGVDGAGAGGHWERTGDKAERTDYAQEMNANLHMVAGLFPQDSLEVTATGFELLRLHVALVLAGQNSSQDCSKAFDDFNLTTAQIEKFLYNRLWVRPADSSWLLGHDTITEHAKNLTGRLSDLQGIEYDQGLTDLLHLHNPESSTYRAPTKQSFTYQQYQVALTLLTPAVPQTAPHTHERSEVWPLRANEISALQSITAEYAERIIYDQGLSTYLYELCNKPEIACQLSQSFIDLLQLDPHFMAKATDALKRRVYNQSFSESTDLPQIEVRRTVDGKGANCVESSLPLSSILKKDTHLTPLFTLNTGNHSQRRVSFRGVPPEDIADSSFDEASVCRNLLPEFQRLADTDKLNRLGVGRGMHRSLVRAVNEVLLQQVVSPSNTYFWLRTMQAFLALGGLFAVIAVLTCSPVAAALGLTTVFGVAASEIAVTATFLAGTSALLAASIFAVRRFEGEPSPVTPLPEFGQGFWL